MGVGIYPVFNPPIPNVDFGSDGKLILSEFRGLDDIATSHGLIPISSFGDNRPIPEGFDGDPDELDEILGPWDAWFPISEGLGCIEGLARILRADASLVNASVDVIEELEGLASCLRKAGESASSFRLEVG